MSARLSVAALHALEELRRRGQAERVAVAGGDDYAWQAPDSCVQWTGSVASELVVAGLAVERGDRLVFLDPRRSAA